MKKILIIVLFQISLIAEIKQYTLKDFVLFVSDKTNNTIILPEQYNTIALSYYETSNINYIATLSQLLTDNDLELIRISNQNFVISKIPQLEDIQDLEKQIFTEVINTRLDTNTINNICQTLNYKCSYISNSNYIISSDTQINKEAFYTDFNINPLFLVGTIYEINLTNAKENKININALLQNSNTIINFDFLGNLKAIYNSTYQNQSQRTYETVLKFLVETGNATILSKPSLALTDNKLVSFHNGDKISVKQSTITNTDTGITQDTYKTVDTGISISLLPQFLPNSSVDIDINLEINSILDYDTNKNLANLTVKNLKGRYNFIKNRPLQLASFNSLTKNDNEVKVPLLSSLPLLGNLFKNINKNQNEKLIIIYFVLQDKPDNLDTQTTLLINTKKQTNKTHNEEIKTLFGL